jgi:hypothetical protein
MSRRKAMYRPDTKDLIKKLLSIKTDGNDNNKVVRIVAKHLSKIYPYDFEFESLSVLKNVIGDIEDKMDPLNKRIKP